MPCMPFDIASRTPSLTQSPMPVGRYTQDNRNQPPQECVHMEQPQPPVLVPCYQYLISPMVQVDQSCAWRRSCSRNTRPTGSQNQSQHHFDDKQESENKQHTTAKRNSNGKQQPDAKQPMKESTGQADGRNKDQAEQGKGSRDPAPQVTQGRAEKQRENLSVEVAQGRPETQENLSAEALLVVPSFGSFGHPLACGKPCKYFWKSRGCKDGSSCTWCHLCEWRRVRSCR